MVVVHVGEPVAHDHAPGHRRVLHDTVHVGGVEGADLAALGAQVAAQFARDVKDTEAGIVRAHVERIAGDPDVVHAAVLGLVERDRARLGDVAHVDHLKSAVGTSGPSLRHALRCIRREDLVGDEDVVLVTPGGVRTADEARAAVHLGLLVERVEVVLELRDHHRVGRCAAADAVADVDDDEPFVPP